MKFRVFTEVASGHKIAVNIDRVLYIKDQHDGTTLIKLEGHKNMLPTFLEASEPFDIVFSRLNTIAE